MADNIVSKDQLIEKSPQIDKEQNDKELIALLHEEDLLPDQV